GRHRAMTTPTGPTEHDADLREYVRVLRARKAEVLIIVTVVAATAMFFAFRQTPIYQGQAKLLVKAVSTTGTAVANLAPNMDTERELVLSQAVAEKVKSDLSLTAGVDTLLHHVDVAVISDTD